MNKAKRIYIDDNGNMVKDAYFIRDKKRKPRKIKHIKIPDNYIDKRDLYLTSISRTNKGLTFWFEDDGGTIYPMCDSELIGWVKKHPIKFEDATWVYKQQGYIYSISFEEERENEDN